MTHSAISPGTRTFVTMCAVAAGTMQVLDSTIANVALPHMQGAMSATQDQIAWVLTSYLVASAVGLMLTSFLVERFGRTRVYVTAIILFTAASMMCGLAQTLSQIVIFRVLQGFLGGSLVPLSLAVVIDIYPPEKRTFGMAIWSLGVIVGPIIGPSLGGYLTDAFNWRWVFFINLPFGILSATGLALKLPETPRQPAHYFDALGFTLLMLAISALQIMLDRGETLDWFASPEIVIEAIIFGTCLYLFTVHLITAERPFISRALFRDKNFVVCALLSGVTGSAQYILAALTPLMLQSLLNYPPTYAGTVMAARGVGAVLGMTVVSRFSPLSPRLTVFSGILGVSLSAWQMSTFTVDVDAWRFETSGALLGFSMSLAWAPMSVMAFTTLDQRLTTEAAAISQLVRSSIGSAGISVMVALLTSNSQANHQILAEHVTAFSRTVQNMAAHTPIGLNSPAGLAFLNGAVDREAAMSAYIDDFVVLGWITLFLAPFVFLIRPKPRALAGPSEPIPQEI